MISKKSSEENKPVKAVIICGPTGSGKSTVGMELAARYNGQIISADSRQVYRRLDIGTAKPSVEDRKKVPHFLIDVADVTEDFSAMRYAELARAALLAITHEQGLPLVVGGTGLYLSALTAGLFEGPDKDPELRQKLQQRADEAGIASLHQELAAIDPESAIGISPSERVRIIRALEVDHLTGKTFTHLKREGQYIRPDAEYLWIGLIYPRRLLYERINRRVDEMVASGLIDEVRGLIADGLAGAITSKKIVGYYEIVAALKGRMPIAEATELVKQHSRNYAKRQLTWFRHQAPVHWLNPYAPDFHDKVFKALDEYLSKRA